MPVKRARQIDGYFLERAVKMTVRLHKLNAEILGSVQNIFFTA
jgi:hypothetical protein